jgi:hypothetical protein
MKTPITEAIEKMQKHYQQGETLENKTEREIGYSMCLKHSIHILTELLPKEKEVIEKSYIAGGDYARCCSLISKDIKESSKTYFNETFTQK